MKALEFEKKMRVAQARLQSIQAQAELPTADRNPLLIEAIAELSISLEELHVATEELHQLNDELLTSRQALDWERQRYQTLFDFAPDAYLVTDMQGVIQLANGAAEVLFNLRRDFFVGKPLTRFIAASDHPLIYRQLQRIDPASQFPQDVDGLSEVVQSKPIPAQAIPATFLLQDQEVTLQPRPHNQPDPQDQHNQQNLVPASLALSREYDEQGQCILCWSFRDLRDRKIAEQKIREQAALLDIATDAIVVRDLDHRILYWNQGAERLYGWRAEDVMGHNATQLLQKEPAPIETIMQVLRDEGKWQGEIHKFTKTGKAILVEGRWSLARDEVGQPQFILSVETDITIKKALETQYSQAQRLDSLGSLASGIAHDLNNVFTPILSMSQLLQITHKDLLDSETHKQFQLIEDSAKQGIDMVKQILTFARGSDGEPIPVNLIPLLGKVIEIGQQTFPKSIKCAHNLPILENYQHLERRDGDGLLWSVLADPTSLHQVFLNLCINARDAMPYGGDLTISAENFVADETFVQRNLEAQVGYYVIVTIADTGTGITPEVRDRMFEPFFTTREIGKGTGLGLSTVLGIVKKLGGFLQVTSQVGQGSEFKVFLPALGTTVTESMATEQPFSGRAN